MTTPLSPVRVLILGTGNMARNHVRGLRAVPGVSVVAGVDTRPEQLERFCADHEIPRSFATIEAALDWGGFDAVSNVTPDGAHMATTLPMLAAGKHVLCEKPLAVNAADAERMARAARAAGVVNRVNLSYREVAAMQKASRMVAAGAIGRVMHLEASYLQSWLTQPAWGDWRSEPQWLWRLSTAWGSKGVLGDVGIHILDFATHVAGSFVSEVSCFLKTYAKAPDGRIGDYVLDANDSATLQVQLRNGALGTIAATRFASGHLNDLRLRLYGDEGGLEVLFEKGVSRLNACIGSANLAAATWEKVETEPVPSNYRRFIDAIRGEVTDDADFERGADLQRVLDAAEASAQESGRSQTVLAPDPLLAVA